ncbi:MAG: ABC transporter ATP-binding protein [Christensenellaceae bacterium]|nr:ABC transporter ATP-binding protein [Christensenellaceae bacterium]
MVKTLSKCIREYKKESILTPVYMAGEVFMEVAITYVLSLLIDRGITPGNMGEILRIGGLLILCALVSLAFGVMSGRSAAVASTGFAKNVRQDMYYNIQTFSFANIDKFSTASLITRLTTDVTRMQQAYMMLIRIAIRSPLMLIFSLIMSFRINARIATVFLCAVPVLGLGIYIMMSKAHPIYERVFKTYDELNRVVQENLRGIRVVKAFVREDHEREKFGKVSDTIYRDFSRAEKITTFGSPLMQASVYTCILLSSWLGAHIIVAGSMTTGQLMSVLTYAMSILSSLMMLSMVLMMLIISRASAERICEVLNERTDIANAPGAETVIPEGSVDFDGVSFSYGGRGGRGGRSCLENIDLHIRSGETIGLIGGTGSGKSTLVQLIPRLYDVTEGCVRVGGRDVREYDIETLRNAVSMVLQKNELFSGTVAENLRWGNENATMEEIRHAARVAQADGFIMAMPEGYDSEMEQGGSNVSGGQKQRLCIARALLKNPKILILDDSTSAVDTATDRAIRDAFRNEMPDVTKIIIAQRISSVQDADRIIVMDNGRITDFGTHDELLNRCCIYREVYESQQKGGGDFDEQ